MHYPMPCLKESLSSFLPVIRLGLANYAIYPITPYLRQAGSLIGLFVLAVGVGDTP